MQDKTIVPEYQPVIFTPDQRHLEGMMYENLTAFDTWPLKSAEYELAAAWFTRNEGPLLVQSVPGLKLTLKGVLHVGNATIWGDDSPEVDAAIAHVLQWIEEKVQEEVDLFKENYT